jgi:hypothetical protein
MLFLWSNLVNYSKKWQFSRKRGVLEKVNLKSILRFSILDILKMSNFDFLGGLLFWTFSKSGL